MIRIVAPYLRVPSIRQGVFVILLLASVLAVTERWLWAPARSAHAERLSEVIALQSQLAVTNARINQVTRYNDMQAMLDTLNTRLAAPVDRSGVIERLSAINTEAGTRIIHGANSFGEPRENIVPVLQDLTVEGPYDSIRTFLNRLAGLETLTLVRQAEFTANPDGTLVRLQMRLVTLSAGTGG